MNYSDTFINRALDGDFSTKMEFANFNGHPREVLTVGDMMLRNHTDPDWDSEKPRHLGMLSFADDERIRMIRKKRGVSK